MPGQVQRAVQVRVDHGDQVGSKHLTHRRRVGRARDLHLGLELLDQFPGRADAHVGGDQGVFDVLPGLLVELAGGDQIQQYRADSRMRPRKPAAQPGQPPGRRRRLLDDATRN